MSGIYLQDLGQQKRSSVELETFLNEIIPNNPAINPIIPTGKGFRLNFPNESDANIFFNIEVYRKLCQAQFDLQFSHLTAATREVIIPNVSYDIYLKTEDTLLGLLNEENSEFNIIHLIKFTSSKTSNRFLRIFLDNKDSQQHLISANRIKLCQVIFRAEAVKNRPYSYNSHQSMNQHYQHQGVRSQRVTTWPDRYHPNQLPASSIWAGPRHTNSSGHSARHPRLPHSHPHQDIRTHSANDIDYNMFTLSSTRITDALYYGLQSPELWIRIYNRILLFNGHSPILIPADIKDDSRCKYYQLNPTHCLRLPPRYCATNIWFTPN